MMMTTTASAYGDTFHHTQQDILMQEPCSQVQHANGAGLQSGQPGPV